MDKYVEKRPWGEFTRYTLNSKSTVKILTIEKGKKLSLQSHKIRDEFWVVLDEGIKIELDGKLIYPKVGEQIMIPHGKKHRLSSLEKRARVLEISVGEFSEDDEIRYEDDYGRK
ncbi:MAG: phosphomannose isomerase type II C-terminal cupin domain [Nanoarchaeota archaeon]|nr:phosphomannose isomerase type II C-terminal cupin domain [Nanoarchaeota archaeon]MBU1322171.1 phosphomannose isomerase type II C-terminal cupin domain [Nanoarchaeota archaeon]MBU1597712.1 phosphomannose isomerase type II C-terminal cupin domain [Nanoarchaeota archaeon]MBU2442190.1 phosphomannose isomerase type II C-terminal cupin domain [Nanoarchaeota archaeon]